MKTVSIIVSALAAFATAAPAAAPASSSPAPAAKRLAVDLGAFNQFSFANQDLQYFNAINGFDLQSLVQLSSFNNLNLGGFQNIFVQDAFDINALLQLQQVALLSQLSGLGIFGNFDLASLQLGTLNLGLLGSSIGGFNLASLVDASLIPQLQAIIQTTRKY